MVVQIARCEGAISREVCLHAQASLMTLCCDLCRNGWTDRNAVWIVDSDGPKEACVKSGCTLAQSGEYDWTIRVRGRYGLFAKLLWPRVL